MPQMYWIIPVEGGAHPDQGLPPGQGGHPSQPIYHPGHPDHGLPPFPAHPIAPGGQPPRPDHSLPPHPDNALPEGGNEIPDNELPMPTPPEEYEDSLIIAVKKPHETDWTVKAYDDARPDQGLPSQPPPRPDQGLPQPTPTPQRAPMPQQGGPGRRR